MNVYRRKKNDHEQIEADMRFITDSLKREKELRKMAIVTIETKEKLIKEKDRKIIELERRQEEIIRVSCYILNTDN